MKMSRREAILSGDRYYKTDMPCKHGHLSKRATEDGSCFECRMTRQREDRRVIRDGMRAGK